VVDYKVVTTSVIPLVVTQVRLYDDVFKHVKEHHGDEDFARSPSFPLPCIVDAVGTAIMRPTFIEQKHDSSIVFVDTGSTNASGDPLRVAVKIVEGTSGRVRTFFFASSNASPNIIWSKP
jgi:hypothetical protein